MNNDLNIRIATAKGYKIVKQDDYFVVTFPNGNMKSFYEHELRKILKDYSLIQNTMELMDEIVAHAKDKAWNLIIYFPYDTDFWYVEQHSERGLPYSTIMGQAKTLPEAICRVWLKIFEKEEK